MTQQNDVFTPKDYAAFLVDKYWNDIPDIFFEEAKECALIAIDSVLDSTRMLVSHYIKSNGVKAYMDIELSKNLTLAYFREVKKEIEKL